MQGRGDPDRVDQRLEQVIEDHRPAREETQVRVQPLPYVGVGGSCRGVNRSHAAIADRGDQHGEQRNQDDGDEVSVRKLLRYAIERHWRDGLDKDDSVKNQVPQRERAAQAWNGSCTGRTGGGGFHGNGYWIMDSREMSILKRFRARQFQVSGFEKLEKRAFEGRN